MKTEQILKTTISEVLNFAILDKNLSPLEFRVLCYIAINIKENNIYLEALKKDLNIKTNNSVANSIKKLISNNYISRTKNNKLNKRGVAFYTYSINLQKAILPFNNNLISCDNYFLTIDYIFNYFFKSIPTTYKIDVSLNRKSIELLLFKDDFTKEQIIKVIDFVALNQELKTKYNRPNLLRKDFKYLFELVKNVDIPPKVIL